MAQLTNTVLNGKLVVNGNIYGNLIGNASTATSATNATSLNGKAESALRVSYATTASTATNATTASTATKISTGAASSTSTYVLLGVTSSTAAQTPVRTGIEIVGTNINANAYTLNVGTITGNYEVEGAVEQATYAVSAGYAGYSLKLNNGAGDLNVGSSIRPVYFSAGVPVEINNDSSVDIISKSAVQVSKTATSSNSTYYIPFVSGSTTAAASLYVGNSKAFTFNPSSGLVVATKFSGSFSGNATSATSAGYTTKVSAASSTGKNYIIGAVSIGSSQSILANANVYVTGGNTVVATTFSGNATSATYASRVVTASKQTGAYHLTMVSASTSDADGAEIFVSNSKALTYNVSTGVVSATKFSGAFSGNATSATSATSAGYTTKVSAASSTGKNYIIGAVSIGSSQSILANANVYVTGGNTVVATTFSGAFSGNATTAGTADVGNKVKTTATSSNSTYYIPFVSSSASAASTSMYVGNSKAFTFNPSSGLVVATKFSGAFSGNATSATYATSLKVQNYTTSPGYLLAAVTRTGDSLPIYSNTNIVYYPSISTLQTPTISVNKITVSNKPVVTDTSSFEHNIKVLTSTEFAAISEKSTSTIYFITP